MVQFLSSNILCLGSGMYNRKGSFSKHLCPKNPFGHLEEEKGTNHRTRLASSLRLWLEIKVHSDELKKKKSISCKLPGVNLCCVRGGSLIPVLCNCSIPSPGFLSLDSSTSPISLGQSASDTRNGILVTISRDLNDFCF